MTRAAMISRFGIIKTSNCLGLTSNILTDCQKSKTSPKRSLELQKVENWTTVVCTELIEATRQKKVKYTEMKKITIYFHTQTKHNKSIPLESIFSETEQQNL